MKNSTFVETANGMIDILNDLLDGTAITVAHAFDHNAGRNTATRNLRIDLLSGNIVAGQRILVHNSKRPGTYDLGDWRFSIIDLEQARDDIAMAVHIRAMDKENLDDTLDEFILDIDCLNTLLPKLEAPIEPPPAPLPKLEPEPQVVFSAPLDTIELAPIPPAQTSPLSFFSEAQRNHIIALVKDIAIASGRSHYHQGVGTGLEADKYRDAWAQLLDYLGWKLIVDDTHLSINWFELEDIFIEPTPTRLADPTPPFTVTETPVSPLGATANKALSIY